MDRQESASLSRRWKIANGVVFENELQGAKQNMVLFAGFVLLITRAGASRQRFRLPVTLSSQHSACTVLTSPLGAARHA